MITGDGNPLSRYEATGHSPTHDTSTSPNRPQPQPQPQPPSIPRPSASLPPPRSPGRRCGRVWSSVDDETAAASAASFASLHSYHSDMALPGSNPLSDQSTLTDANTTDASQLTEQRANTATATHQGLLAAPILCTLPAARTKAESTVRNDPPLTCASGLISFFSPSAADPSSSSAPASDDEDELPSECDDDADGPTTVTAGGDEDDPFDATFSISHTAYPVADEETGEVELLNDIVFFGELGRGAYGRVMHGICDRYDFELAVKEVPRKLLASTQKLTRVALPDGRVTAVNLAAEVRAMAQLRHPCIVPILELIDDPAQSSVYMVMPRIQGKQAGETSLADDEDEDEEAGVLRCTTVPDPVLRAIAADVVSALCYCQQNFILHGDIKPENILLELLPSVSAANEATGAQTDESGGSGAAKSRVRAKLADFGVSAVLHGGQWRYTDSRTVAAAGCNQDDDEPRSRASSRSASLTEAPTATTADFDGTPADLGLPTPVKLVRSLRGRRGAADDGDDPASGDDDADAMGDLFSTIAPLKPIGFLDRDDHGAEEEEEEEEDEVEEGNKKHAKNTPEEGGNQQQTKKRSPSNGDCHATRVDDKIANDDGDALLATLFDVNADDPLAQTAKHACNDTAARATSTAADGDDDEINKSPLPSVGGARPAAARAFGTPALLAPELVTGATSHPTPASDAWALGVSLFGLRYGRLPFGGTSHTALQRAIVEDDPRFPPVPAWDRDARRWRAFIRALLVKDPSTRLTVAEAAHAAVLQGVRDIDDDIRRAVGL